MTLAANESEKSSPKISKLPLPISDSPLVIDLPDGQKIVVGKMTLGSVIEVATWRGVGRPDSRTSRLMLGMGSGNVNEDSESQSNSPREGEKRAPVKPKGFAGFLFTIQHFVKNFSRINWSATFKALIGSVSAKKRKKPAALEGANPETPVQSMSVTTEIKPAVTISRASEDADIEEWLNKITQKATRDTAAKKPAVKSAGSSSGKAKASVKKAAPKAANPRSAKR